MQVTLAALGSAIVDSRLARRGDILVARWRGAASLCYPIHADRDPADRQATAEPHAGQTISPNRAAARPLGQIAFREKCAQCCGAVAIPLPSIFMKSA